METLCFRQFAIARSMVHHAMAWTPPGSIASGQAQRQSKEDRRARHGHSAKPKSTSIQMYFIFLVNLQLTPSSVKKGGVSRRWRAMRLNGVLRFVLRDLASCKVQLSKTRIEPLITSQLQVEPVDQLAGVGHCGCRARARDGAWMTRFARTRAQAHKGGQSGSMLMTEHGPAAKGVLCAVSTPHPAYMDPASTDCRARLAVRGR